jgi:hypothetical protein
MGMKQKDKRRYFILDKREKTIGSKCCNLTRNGVKLSFADVKAYDVRSLCGQDSVFYNVPITDNAEYTLEPV